MTAEGLYESRMQELAESVEDLGQSSSLKCDWNLDVYNLDGADPAGAGGGGVDSQPAGAETSTTGAVRGQSFRSTPASTGKSVFNVEVGEFVALPTPPCMKESVSIGKVISIEDGDGGKEPELHWYMPSRVIPGSGRSKYGKGRWVPEFLKEYGKLVPSVGTEDVAAVSSKFLNLTAQGKLPTHVWGAVAESTAPSEEEGGEGGEEKDDGSLEQEEEGEGGEEEGSLEQEGGGGIAGSDDPQQEALDLPEDASVSLVALARAMPPPNIRITAAFHRPRRGSSTAGQSSQS